MADEYGVPDRLGEGGMGLSAAHPMPDGTTIISLLRALFAGGAAPVANSAALTAIPAASRSDGQERIKLDTLDSWIFDADGVGVATAWKLVPDTGTGRWIRTSPSLIDLASTAAGLGASLLGVQDAAGRIAAAQVEAALAELAGRILGPVADATALQAVAAAVRVNGMVVTKLDDDTQWTFDSGSSASASDWVIVPGAGTGRWLRKFVTLADLTTLKAPAMQAVNATLSSGTIAITSGIVVAANSEVVPLLIGDITGSTNFGSLRERKASRVNGADGVGAVTVDAVGDDGQLDADAAGAIRVLIFTPL